MYNKIVNPETNRKVDVQSTLGRKIVKGYMAKAKLSGGDCPFQDGGSKRKSSFKKRGGDDRCDDGLKWNEELGMCEFSMDGGAKRRQRKSSRRVARKHRGGDDRCDEGESYSPDYQMCVNDELLAVEAANRSNNNVAKAVEQSEGMRRARRAAPVQRAQAGGFKRRNTRKSQRKSTRHSARKSSRKNSRK